MSIFQNVFASTSVDHASVDHPETATLDLLLLICKSVHMKILFNHSFEGKLSIMGLNWVLPAVLFAH